MSWNIHIIENQINSIVLWVKIMSQVSTHVALDHQTYSALAQHTQITWTAVLNCDEPSRVGRWRFCYITYQSNIQLWTTRPSSYKKFKQRLKKKT